MDHDNGNGGLGTLTSAHRNAYFYGKLLDVGHLEMEQRYFNRKRWLLNRLALGSGVLCGLQVTAADDPPRLVVAPGVAIDGLGREIVVPAAVELDPWKVTGDDGQEVELANDESHDVYVCLEYRECRTDFQPAYVTECESEPHGKPGTIVESFLLHVREGEPPSVPVDAALCRALTGGAGPADRRARLCGLRSRVGCAPGDDDPCVVLATVTLEPTDDLGEAGVGTPDNCAARTQLYSNQRLFDLLLCLGDSRGGGTTTTPPATALTQIDGMSWTHDEEILIGDFPDEFSVWFTNPVTPPALPATKGRAWFVVTLEMPAGGSRGVMSTMSAGGTAPAGIFTTVVLDGSVQLGNAGATAGSYSRATFVLAPEFLTVLQAFKDSVAEAEDDTTDDTDDTGTGDTLPPPRLLCRITVKCDFLLDDNGAAVDGNHLGGTLPTGDGIAGGAFESWFFITVSRTEP